MTAMWLSLMLLLSMVAVAAPADAQVGDRTVFDFENSNQKWWTNPRGAGATASTSLRSGKLQLTVDLPARTRAWSGKNVGVTNWSRHKGLKFQMDGAGSGTRITITFHEGPGRERFEHTFVDNVIGPRTLTVPFTEFKRTNYQPAGAPNDGLNLVGVRSMYLGFRGKAKINMTIDSVVLTNNVTVEPQRQPVLLGRTAKPIAEDFNGGLIRLNCSNNRNFPVRNDDPLVHFGQVGGSHQHTFIGNVSADAFSVNGTNANPNNIAFAQRTSCPGGGANMSAYWMPTLKNAAGQIRHPDDAIIYYKRGSVDVADIIPFPQGLTMITGDAKATSPQPFDVVRWSCRGTSELDKPTIPHCPAGNELVMSLDFPQCWDGRRLSSSDQSHMAHDVPNLGVRVDRNGKNYYRRCPTSHPKVLPEITYQFHWRVEAGEQPGEWWLASDDKNHDGRPDHPGGLTTHADWMNGWHPGILHRAVNNCIGRGLFCLDQIDETTTLRHP